MESRRAALRGHKCGWPPSTVSSDIQIAPRRQGKTDLGQFLLWLDNGACGRARAGRERVESSEPGPAGVVGLNLTGVPWPAVDGRLPPQGLADGAGGVAGAHRVRGAPTDVRRYRALGADDGGAVTVGQDRMTCAGVRTSTARRPERQPGSGA